MAKRGRPKKDPDERLSESFHLRLTPADAEFLEAVARELNSTSVVVMRELVEQRRLELEKEIMKQL